MNDVKPSRYPLSGALVLIFALVLTGCIQFPSAQDSGQGTAQNSGQDPGQASPQAEPSATPQQEPQPNPFPTPETVPETARATDPFTRGRESAPEEPSPNCLTGAEAACRDAAFEQAPQGAAPPRSGMSEQTTVESLDQYLNRIIADLDKKWDAWFLAQGFQQPHLNYELVLSGEQPYRSLCPSQGGGALIVNDSHPNAYYCPNDPYGNTGSINNGTMILPATTMQQMWTGQIFQKQSQYPGDFAAATLVAHEYGHHIQDELWIQWHAYYPNYDYSFAGSDLEAIADCFAGNWMASTYYDATLKPGDYEEAIAALQAIGAEQPGGSHPVAQERKAAILLGYNGNSSYGPGDPYACINAYWQPEPMG